MTSKTVNGVTFQQVNPEVRKQLPSNGFKSDYVYNRDRETVHSTYAEPDMRVIYHVDKTGEKKLKQPLKDMGKLVFVGSGKWVKITP